MFTYKQLEAHLDAGKIHQFGASEMTRQMLLRSRKQIELSKKLLEREVPHVWHPEPPKEDDLEANARNERR